jgi:xanthine dehydrogenase accessory factor
MIWTFILQKLEEDKRVVLLTVVESRGSSPGRPGFKMAVSEDEWEGSVGGGIMEFELMALAKEMFQSGQKVRLKRLVHGGDHGPDSSGMICAGSQKVALVLLEQAHLSTIQKMVKYASGKMTIASDGLAFLPAEEGGKLPAQKLFKEGDQWSYEENLGARPHLYIFGGGHVGLAVSRCFSLLDFDITLFDNRSDELKTIRSNHYIEDIQIIDYTQAEDVVPDGPDHYVVIMTSSHESDGLILEQMLSKKLSYLGMLGSVKKAKFIFNVLQKTGVSEEELQRVDTPMGLEIASETPMEIAISIAAKIIQIKNTKG